MKDDNYGFIADGWHGPVDPIKSDGWHGQIEGYNDFIDGWHGSVG